MGIETILRLADEEKKKMETIYDYLWELAYTAEEILMINAYYEHEYEQIVKRFGERLREAQK